ncbi:MAG: N-6 DNA methylase [Bacteroidota bacterium]|nr:N-6 DNA methylase [Bacteroidota bacterium]
MKKEAAKKELTKLISDYEIHREQYAQKNYDEHQFCTQVLNRFFKLLGWDVENIANHSEYYCEIILQYRLKGKSSTTFPDYAFGFPAKTNPKFFVEAKTPSTIVKQDKDAAHQTRRYGNSGTLAISVLTNFEEFAVYDCSVKPKGTEAAAFARIEYFTYKEYLNRFDFLWDTFSTEGIKTGFFDKYVQTDTKKKGSSPLDKEFVETLDNWRKLLADDIAGNNLKLDDEEINSAVQQTIDRIIFLRFCEDRATEKFGTLQQTTGKGDYYKNLFVHFKQADEKYNSGLFDFDKDKVSHKLRIDNKVVKKIISALYRPNNDYEFGVMPVEVLGNAYEEFLGKIIHITPGHKARINIDKKPEVQKAGGVFYTPQYIVNYIVENTLGKLIKGKTPEQISKIRVLDPACGSGSFLLGAYVYLLRYHTDYYWKQDYHKRKIKNNPLTPNGHLSVTEKKKILTNNIYGVDIDANAVEVTKLSLLLKAMEGETEASVAHQLQLFKKGILPDLDQNIQSGNSLIEPDFYDGKIVYDKETDKIKAFNWKTAFPKVFKDDGFDVVIGNPPYIMLQTMENREVFDYALEKYKSAKYKIDTYQLFTERAIQLSKPKGESAFITPNSFLKNIHSEPIRKILIENTTIQEILLFNYFVFKSASVDTSIFILRKGKPSPKAKLSVKKAETEFEVTEVNSLFQSSLKQNSNLNFNLSITESDRKILQKIESSQTTPLKKLCEAYFGIQTYDRDTYVTLNKKNKDYVPVIDGGNIERFYLNKPSEYVNFIPSAIKSGGDKQVYLKDRICIRQIGKTPIAAIVPAKIYTLNTIYNVYLKDKNSESLVYILAIIDSNVIKYFWVKNHFDEKDTYPKIKKEAILSIPLVQLKIQNQKAIRSGIIKQANTLIQLYKDSHITSKGADNRTQHRIDYLKEEINKKVYELYGLSKKEINIIEKTLE